MKELTQRQATELKNDFEFKNFDVIEFVQYNELVKILSHYLNIDKMGGFLLRDKKTGFLYLSFNIGSNCYPQLDDKIIEGVDKLKGDF